MSTGQVLVTKIGCVYSCTVQGVHSSVQVYRQSGERGDGAMDQQSVHRYTPVTAEHSVIVISKVMIVMMTVMSVMLVIQSDERLLSDPCYSRCVTTLYSQSPLPSPSGRTGSIY